MPFAPEPASHFALYSPDPQRRVTGGFLYNQQLCDALSELGYTWLIESDSDEEPDADIHLVDSLLATEYVKRCEHKQKALTKAVFLYHLPPFAGQSVPQWWLTIEKQLIESAKIVVTGTQCFELLMARHRLTEQQLRPLVPIITPGIDNKWQHKTQFSDLPEKLLVVASVIPEKGIEQVIRLLDELRGFSWQCEIYGETQQNPRFYEQTKQQLDELGLAQRIKFAGTVPRHQMNQVMLQADLLLHFSEFETYSMVTAEAIATGLPALSFPVGEVEQFAQAKSMQYVNPESFLEQYSQLRSLLMDTHHYGQLCYRCPVDVRNWTQVAREWETVFDNINRYQETALSSSPSNSVSNPLSDSPPSLAGRHVATPDMISGVAN